MAAGSGTARTEKAILDLCERRRVSAQQARQRYEADWFLDLAFFEGHQWLAWDGARLFRPAMPAGRLTLTDNRIQPIVRTEVAKLTKSRPGWLCTPRTADEQAVQHALTGERLLEWGYDHLDFAYHRREAVTWARVTGAGFVKATWDPTLGPAVEIMVDDQGKPLRDEKTRRLRRRAPGDQAKSLKLGSGDVCLSTRAPFDIYPDPLATGMNDLRWLIDEAVRAPEYVKDRYGKDVAPDAPAQVGVVQSRFPSGGASSGEKVGVRVWEMWEAPTPKSPGGRHVVWAGGQLLLDEQNVYGQIPYVMFPGITIPGRFWPGSITTQLRPVQARRNKLLSQVSENVARFANPSLLIDSMSNIVYTGAVGEQIRYQSGIGEKPSYMQPPQMSADTFRMLQETEASLREISGQSEVSNGAVPAGVTAASAITLLQEQDATRIAPDVESMEDALSEVGQLVLSMMARFYKNERMTVIVGEDGVIDLEAFRGGEQFRVPDVKVEAGSTFPRSLAAKQAAIRDTLNLMLQYGVPISPDTMGRTLRDMGVGALDKIVGSFSADAAQVAREHLDFLQGVDPVVNPLVDNSAIHLEGHKDFAKSARFRALPPARQLVLMQHIQDTEAQLQTEAAAAAPPPGTPTGGPVPPAPAGGGAPVDQVPTTASGNAAPMDPASGFAAGPNV